MNADTETNVDTARTRAERLVQEGAHCLVGPFDSGAAARHRSGRRAAGVPFVINIAAAPQITEQGYKYVFRNFPVAVGVGDQRSELINDLFQATGARRARRCSCTSTTRSGRPMQSDRRNRAEAQFAVQARQKIDYDPAAKDLSVEIAKAKSDPGRFPAPRLAFKRRDRAAPRDRKSVQSHGHHQPGLAGM